MGIARAATRKRSFGRTAWRWGESEIAAAFMRFWLDSVLARFSEHGDRIAGGASRAHYRERRKNVGEHPRATLSQSLEIHSLMEMDPMLHDEMLMTRVKDLRVDRRHHLDGEIVGADDA